jgi:MoaA/NifB/PqqE/SkfB family radical SAM enzyme
MRKSEKINKTLGLLKTAPDVLSMIPTVLFKDSQSFKTYTNLFIKMFQIKALGAKLPIYASVDVTNRCNLKCMHCYWWKNWKQRKELSTEGWRKVIRNKLKNKKLYQVALTGGEPLLRRDVIKVFKEEMRNKIYVVTNGTLPLVDFNGISYIVSIDGTEEVHNFIRGLKVYEKIRQNVKQFDGDVLLNMTINTINFECIEDVVKEWHELVHGINFQFHTPFDLNDSLWVPYGKQRDEIIKKLMKLKEEYYGLILNTKRQLDILRSNGWTKNCPNWAFIALNHLGQPKDPCILGGAKKPICERCGICESSGMYTAIQGDMEWLALYKKRHDEK